MREIRIDCFKDSKICQIVSEKQNFQVNELEDQEYSLVIQNFSNQDCRLFIFANSQDQSELSLLIQKDQEIIFHDQLNNFFNQKIDLGNIDKQSAQNYFFYFDVSKLVFTKQNLSLNFDLSLEYSCLEPTIVDIEEPIIAETSSAVLGANIVELSSHKNFLLPALICLFVVIFFVIMKLINGKKKKKQTRFLVQTKPHF